MKHTRLYPVLLCTVLGVPSIAVADLPGGPPTRRPGSPSTASGSARSFNQNQLRRQGLVSRLGDRTRMLQNRLRSTSRQLQARGARGASGRMLSSRFALSRHLGARFEARAIRAENPNLTHDHHGVVPAHVFADFAHHDESHAERHASQGRPQVANYYRTRAQFFRRQAANRTVRRVGRGLAVEAEHVSEEARSLGNLASEAAVEARRVGDHETAHQLEQVAANHYGVAARAEAFAKWSNDSHGIAEGASAPDEHGFDQAVYTAGNTETQPGKLVYRTGDAPHEDATVRDAADGVARTAAFQRNTFGYNVMKSLARLRGQIASTVHFGRGYNNAYWDSTQMVYGDGDGVLFQSFAGEVTVPAHELHHGITEAKAPLDYVGQSGALNEHRSDWGALQVKQEMYGQTVENGDWDIGADREGNRSIFTSQVQSGLAGRPAALRRADFPGTGYKMGTRGDRQPADMDGYYSGPQDNGGVHINSGIFNRAAVEFSKNLVKVVGPGVRIYGQDSIPAQVWEAGMNTLGPRATFQQAANAVYQAAVRLHPDRPEIAQAARDAFTTVKVPVASSVQFLGRSKMLNGAAFRLRGNLAKRARVRFMQREAAAHDHGA